MESLITDTSTSTHPVIGVFPNNWEFSRFGREFERSNERNGDSPIGPMLSVSEYRGIEVRTNFRDGQLPSEDVSHYRVVRPGQLVANLMWLDHGGLGVSHFPGYVSPAYMAFNISERVDPAFAHHVLRSSVYVDSYKRLGRGVRPNSQMVDSVDLRQLPFPLPPLETQQRIADYLDRETAEIDAAVADLDRYVELLEKRRSMITSAALTGADSVKLAHLVRFRNGQDWKDVATPDGEFPVYGSGGEFGRASNFLHDGEAILFGRKGTVDRPIYVDEKFWTVDTMYYAVPNKDKCLGKYIFYWATTIPFETITTNTALPSVTSMDLSQLYVPLPPLESQQRIADYLDRETAEIDSLIADSTKLRDLLLKRRSVLITEVVTGRKQV